MDCPPPVRLQCNVCLWCLWGPPEKTTKQCTRQSITSTIDVVSLTSVSCYISLMLDVSGRPNQRDWRDYANNLHFCCAVLSRQSIKNLAYVQRIPNEGAFELTDTTIPTSLTCVRLLSIFLVHSLVTNADQLLILGVTCTVCFTGRSVL